MEQKMETAIIRYIGTTRRIQSFIPRTSFLKFRERCVLLSIDQTTALELCHAGPEENLVVGGESGNKCMYACMYVYTYM